MAHDGHRLAETDIAAVQARVDADPRVQAILRDPKLYPRDKMLRLAAVQQELGLPESYTLDSEGRVRFNDGVDWKKWAVPAIGVGTLGAGALGAFGSGVSSALGGGSAGANAATSMAVPEQGVDAIPGLFGGGVKESASMYPFLKGAAGSAGRGLFEGMTGDAPDWLKAAIASMAGIGGAMASRQGPSAEENALNAQAQRILGQQEARTQYADPLYKATMQMAYGLLPNRPGGYPGGD